MFLRPVRSLTAAALILAAGACAPRDATPADTAVVDDLGDTVHFGVASSRVVSLSPVTTELMFAIGAGASLVGRTHWDLYPVAARAIADLGNGMQPNIEAVVGTHPDLVLLYASEGNRASARRLRAVGIQTLSLHMDQVSDFRRVATMVARAVGRDSAGPLVADSVEATIARVRAMPRPASTPRVFWFIWESPLYTIGKGSFLSTLVEIAGATNVFGDLDASAPQVTLEEVVRRNPDVVITGPVTAEKIRQLPAWQAVPAVRKGRIVVVDTSLVGRPGPRLGEAALHVRHLLIGDTLR